LSSAFGKRLLAGLGDGLLGLTLRHVRHASRWHLRGPLDAALRAGEPVIIAAWRQDIVPLFHYLVTFTGFEQREPFVCENNGAFAARILRPWGFRCVDSVRAAVAAGKSAVVLADGPEPPPYAMRPDPLSLAQATGRPLFLVRAWARPQLLVARTWFRMTVPLPRAHYALFSEGPVECGGSVEEGRLRAEASLQRLCEEADAFLYLRRRVRGGIRLGAGNV